MPVLPADHECPPDAQLVELIEGRLAAPVVEQIHAHVATCTTCRELLHLLRPPELSGVSTDERDVGPSGLGLDGSFGSLARWELLCRGASLGRYLVLSLLGRGGMGEVYVAYDPELDRRVAVKVLHVARDAEEGRKRLLREARALGRLSHPNVVQVYDVGEHEGDVFIAMELVDGSSLDAFCNGPPRPSWREVLEAYLDAARGLAAAHEKGIVHRDVKPSNILRGTDGRVRVADLGLAAIHEARRELPREHADDGAGGEPSPSLVGACASRLTTTGAVLGTPLYMAPEQHEGAEATAASDQYSFCVALHEGLYGVAPFVVTAGGSTRDVIGGLVVAKAAGPKPTPPTNTPVPAHVYRALAIGLAPDPRDRHASMAALVAALRDDPDARRRRRWWRLGGGVAATAFAAIALAGWARTGALRDPCAHPELELVDVWNEHVEARTREAFLATGRSYADDTTTRVAALLDRYAGDWKSMRREVCEATRASPGREILALRDTCLLRRRGQLLALTALFTERPDAQVLDKAVTSAASLFPIAGCADTEALLAPVRPPEDPAVRARLASLQPRVDRVEALFRAGKFKDGLAAAEPLLPEARELSYAPIEAQVKFWLGQLHDKGAEYEPAKVLLRDAAIAAAEGGDTALAAAAWTRLYFVAGDHQLRFDEANLLRAVAPVMIRAKDDRSQATWLYAEGSVLRRMGKSAEAKVALEHALALQDKILGPEHPDVASSLTALGNVMVDMGEYPEALPVLERALAIKEKVLGLEHPDLVTSLSGLGHVTFHLGEYRRALASFESALAIGEKALGSDNPSVGAVAAGAATALLYLDDDRRALVMFERAYATLEKSVGPDYPTSAYAKIGEAEARLRLGELDAAVGLAEHALSTIEKTLGPTHVNVADALLVLGEAHLRRGKSEEAIAVLERGLAVGDPGTKAEIRLVLAGALWPRDQPRARSLVEEARTHYARLGHRPGLDRVARWLADHGK